MGTYVTTKNVSDLSATIDLDVTVDNDSKTAADIIAITRIYSIDARGNKTGKAIGSFPNLSTSIAAGGSGKVHGTISIKNPKLWDHLPRNSLIVMLL